MKCYIYFIVNNITKERYVGQTTNFYRRINEHFSKLREGVHPNPKMQNSFNKYSEENFSYSKITFEDISKKELDDQEIYYINYYNSLENGFNLTPGGTGGDTRSKLNFDQFCFAYFGNIKFDGMTNKTGKYLGVDSSCISAIRRKKSYDKFREKAESLPEEEKNQYLQNFIEVFNLDTEKAWVVQKTPDAELTFKIMCVVSSYGTGIEKAVLTHLGLSKGFMFHLMKGKGRQEIKEKYKNTLQEEIEKIGKKLFEEWNLQSYSKNKIKPRFTNLINKYSS